MAGLKRDKVNREQGVVILPITTNIAVGTEDVQLQNVVEYDIDCGIRDANEMYDPYLGNAVGDAVFDAGEGTNTTGNICDAGVGEGGTFYILAEDGSRLENPDDVFWVLEAAPA